MPVVAGALGPYQNAGAPVTAVSEVQTLSITGTPTGGTFRLSFQGNTTAPITWSNVNATLLAAVDAALEALGTIGTGNIAAAAGTLTAGIGTITLTFGGALAGRAVPTITVEEMLLTGTTPGVSVAETTAGVSPTALGARKGALLIDVTNGTLYQNTGTPTSPTWTTR